MKEAYGRVIDLVANDAIDFRAIGLSLAKARPDVFLALHDLAANPTNDKRVEMDNAIRKLYASGSKVEAIKFCRQETGWGLKEAKDYCDALGARGVPNTVPSTAKANMNTLKSLLDDLLGSSGSTTAADKPRNAEETFS